MPGSTTYAQTDGERLRLGRLNSGSPESQFADLFLDRSDTALHIATPASEDMAFDVGTTQLARLDGGQSAWSFGGANVDGSAFIVNNLTARTMITSVGYEFHMPAQTNLVDNSSGSVAIGAAVFLGIPTYNQSPASACDFTQTVGATMVIAGNPVSVACDVVVTTGYALAILDGALAMGLIGGCGAEVHINGSTSQVSIIASGASPTCVTYTIPSDNCANTEQLTTNGCGLLSWGGAGSLRHLKNILGLTCKNEAYDNIVNTNVYDFHYKPEHWKKNIGANRIEPFTGIIADEAPWAMHGKELAHFSPINAFGQMMAAVQVIAEKVTKLEAQLA